MAMEDDQLLQLLTPESSPEASLRALYVYESKMAMLSRLASTARGAELLLESGLVVRLAEMNVYSARPEISSMAMEEDDAVIPSALARFHQILFPALKLCLSVLTSLGSDNRSATSQIHHFITSNEELVRIVLRTRGVWFLPHLQVVFTNTIQINILPITYCIL